MDVVNVYISSGEIKYYCKYSQKDQQYIIDLSRKIADKLLCVTKRKVLSELLKNFLNKH